MTCFRARHARPEHQAIILAVFAGIFAWVMQAALDYYFYAGRTYPEHLFLNVPVREVSSRATIIGCFLLSGFIISRVIQRLERTTRRAARLDSVVRAVRSVNQIITRETDRRTLARRSCETLVDGLGYRRVEVLLDGRTAGRADLSDDPADWDESDAREHVSVSIECLGAGYGELQVTPAGSTMWDAEELALLTEVAEDIGFALRGIGISEKLDRQREELETILDSVPAYISYKDRHGRYLRVNKATADLARVPAERWVGRTLPEIIPGATESSRGIEAEVIATGKPKRTAIGTLPFASEKRWVQTDRIPYRNAQGEASGVISLSIDITQLMEAQRDLAIKDEQLRQSQKLEAIGLLAGGIAHDFNNLLTAISGYAELAKAHVDSDTPAAPMLESVTDAAGRAASLTQQLLAFSRKQPLALAQEDLSTIVRGMKDILSCLVGESIDLRSCLAADLGRIEVDASQIEQVILNLAVNARDAMPDGGTLTITTRRAAPDETAVATDPYEASRECVCLSVSDTGTGIDTETLDHIFEPFFTTKEPGVGTGLGLSVVFGIVEQHGGWIKARTEPGRGTAFDIYLPVAPEPEPEPAPDMSSDGIDHEKTGCGSRILLVEDEEAVRDFAAHALRHFGYQIVEAESAEEAIKVLERDDAFQMVFSDVVLPGKSGIELAEEVMAAGSGIRILLASGYPDCGATGSHPRQMGIPFLSKPYSMRALLESVRAALC